MNEFQGVNIPGCIGEALKLLDNLKELGALQVRDHGTQAAEHMNFSTAELREANNLMMDARRGARLLETLLRPVRAGKHARGVEGVGVWHREGALASLRESEH